MTLAEWVVESARKAAARTREGKPMSDDQWAMSVSGDWIWIHPESERTPPR